MKLVGQFSLSSICTKAFHDIFDFMEMEGDVFRHVPIQWLSVILAIAKIY
jgi:hypothetical protein